MIFSCETKDDPDSEKTVEQISPTYYQLVFEVKGALFQPNLYKSLLGTTCWVNLSYYNI